SFPSSSWTNAPYGVMRWTRPSTTAPTSSSAIGTPFRRWTRTSDPRALSHRPQDPSTADGGGREVSAGRPGNRDRPSRQHPSPPRPTTRPAGGRSGGLLGAEALHSLSPGNAD